MKRLLPAALAALLFAVPVLAATETVSVVVLKTSIRREPQFYAPTLQPAQLGEAFDVLAREKGWIKVGTKSGAGWVHASAVTARRVAAGAAGPAAGAIDDRDVAYAGKGFNPQVESEYRKKNPQADYAAVDRMERIGVGEQAVLDFVREGGLHPRGAGR